MNEDLRSRTAELDTSREDLARMNAELESKVEELERANIELQYLIDATGIPKVFLDSELRLQRFSPAAQSLFGFKPTDLGLPLSELSITSHYPEAVADAEGSLANRDPKQRDFHAGQRRFLARMLRPAPTVVESPE